MMLKAGVARLVVRTMLRVALRVAESERVAGFEVFFGPDQRDSDAIAKIRAALAIIAEHDSRRYARMHRDMSRLILVGKGLHVHADLRVGTLNGPWLGRSSVYEVAVSLIEMAARARIGRMAGHGGMNGWSRERIGRRAALEQLAFLSRLPEGTGGVQRLEAHVRTKLGTISG